MAEWFRHPTHNWYYAGSIPAECKIIKANIFLLFFAEYFLKEKKGYKKCLDRKEMIILLIKLLPL